MKAACMNKNQNPWKTSEIPNPHWVSIADYSLNPLHRGDPCNGVMMIVIIIIIKVLFTQVMPQRCIDHLVLLKLSHHYQHLLQNK